MVREQSIQERLQKGKTFYILNSNGILTDSNYLKDKLEKRHSIPTSSGKIFNLKSPTEPVSKVPSRPELTSMDNRINIFWAGRFDRQKIFDVFLDITKICPEFNFYAWGKIVLDNTKTYNIPSNLKIFHPFDRLLSN